LGGFERDKSCFPPQLSGIANSASAGCDRIFGGVVIFIEDQSGNYRYQAPEIDHALEVSGASLLVAHAERDDVLAASERAPGLPLGRISYGPRGDRIASLRNS
jgi:hypothetical protein